MYSGFDGSYVTFYSLRLGVTSLEKSEFGQLCTFTASYVSNSVVSISSSSLQISGIIFYFQCDMLKSPTKGPCNTDKNLLVVGLYLYDNNTVILQNIIFLQ